MFYLKNNALHKKQIFFYAVIFATAIKYQEIIK